MPELGLNKIPIMGKEFWLQTGKQICVEIQKDAKAGLMQDGKRNLHYKSEKYTKYKANRMERFTTREYKKGTKTIPPGFIANQGTKLNAFKAQSIVSNNIAYVDMTLTGKTLRGLKPKKAGDTNVILAFNSEDTQKVLGNRDNGYNIVGLNDKNIRIVKNEIVKKFEQNIKRDLLKILKIEVRI